MKNLIIEELKKAGINPAGCYESLPNIIIDALDYIEVLGYDEWKKTSATGPAVNNIIKELMG